jgi:hypothetical protein
VDAGLATRLAGVLRAADPDRYFASLFAPAALRPHLVALYAFNAEVARIAENVREPMLGAIRLEWWRETAEGAAAGKARNHDVARGLAALFAGTTVELGALEAIIAARAFDSSADRFADFAALEKYLDATSGALMRIAAAILGGDPLRVGEAGLAYGLAGILRSLERPRNSSIWSAAMSAAPPSSARRAFARATTSWPHAKRRNQASRWRRSCRRRWCRSICATWESRAMCPSIESRWRCLPRR